MYMYNSSDTYQYVAHQYNKKTYYKHVTTVVLRVVKIHHLKKETFILFK